MKRILSMILAAVLVAALFTACGTQQTSGDAEASQAQDADGQAAGDADDYGTVHTLYYKDSTKSGIAVATFFNSATGESREVRMKSVDIGDDAITYACEADCSVYNMAYVTCGEKQTLRFAFNPCTSGWQTVENELLPYTEGTDPDYLADYDEVSLTGYGYKKNIYIWTPDGYDPASQEKYAAVYMLDGQGMAYFGWPNQTLKGCPVATEQINAMIAETGRKAIFVAIQSDVARGNELIPKIGPSDGDVVFGDMEYDCMDGIQMGDFIAHTLVPYVQEHYNVYTDPVHTAIAGCSFGGLEAFYITVEYPEVFGTAGALSPSLYIYNDDVWRAYLSEKDFGDSAPFLYIYSGGENDTNRNGEIDAMMALLAELDYPSDKYALNYYDEGTHNSILWRNVFSEFLTAMMYRRIVPLLK